MTWLVVAVRQGRERKVERKLDDLLLPTFLPIFRNEYRRKVLMFPRYVMVKQIDRWQRVYRVDGVQHVLMNAGVASTLPDSFVRGLRACEVDGVIHIDKWIPPDVPEYAALSVGQRVRIARGSLQNLFALYAGLDRGGRNLVYVNFLGRDMCVPVQREDLQSS
jgi:transcription antitermination factor NusG